MTIRDLSALIKTAKGSLSSDPQSGGILKVLGVAGFAEKIENGVGSGRTYQVLHAPGEPNFVLVEKWVDRDGGMRTMYYPFVITDDKRDANIQIIRNIQMPDTATTAPVVSSDIFSNVLDNLEHSLDEFLSFAKA